MSKLTALRRIQAAHTGIAQPLAAYRHRRVADRPLVLVPLMLAGEAAAPLAAAVGTDRRRPHLLFVHQPLDRNQRYAFATALGEILLAHVADHRTTRHAQAASRRDAQSTVYSNAPQIVVPNSGGIKTLAQFARMTRYRTTTGPYAVAPSVPLLGRWLTFYTDRAETPGSALLIAATDLLCEQWATGQSPAEDAHLGALLGWIDPPAGTTGPAAALAAENPLTTPPAGPSTDPGFDNTELYPAIEAYRRAHRSGKPADIRRAEEGIEHAASDQLLPTWESVWRSISLLRSIPEAPSAADHWFEDRRAFTGHCDHIDGAGAPQPRRDAADTASRRLNRLEAAAERYEARRALEDPFILADRRTAGLAFGGTVTAVDAGRAVESDSGRQLSRPAFTLMTEERAHLLKRAQLASPDMPTGHRARILDIEPADDGFAVSMEVIAGMGRSRAPAPGSVPTEGAELTYTAAPEFFVPLEFPPAERTPWTHRPDLPDADDDTTFEENEE